MLVGTDIAAATAIIDALDIDILGLNCATGPQEMAEHLRYLVAELAGADLGAAQCRPARTGRRQDPLSPRPGRARRLAGALHHRGRRQRDRRLLRHRDRAYPGAGSDAPKAGRGRCIARSPATRESPQAPPPGFASLFSAVRLSAGERLSLDRRALQCQRFQGVSRTAGSGRLGCLRRDGARRR